MKYKYTLVYLVILLVYLVNLPSISSFDVDISNNPILIEVSNDTLYIKSVNFPINNNNMTLNFTVSSNGNETVCSISSQQMTFNNYYIRNTTQIVDITLMERYLSCMSDKTTLDSQSKTCFENLATCNIQSLNYSQDKSNLANCTFDKMILQNTINQKDSIVSQKNKEMEEQKNQKFLFGIGGIVLGILGVLGFQGKLFNKVKDKGQEEFGTSTAG